MHLCIRKNLCQMIAHRKISRIIASRFGRKSSKRWNMSLSKTTGGVISPGDYCAVRTGDPPAAATSFLTYIGRIEWLDGHCMAGIHDFRLRCPRLSRRESWAPAPSTIEATPLPCLLFAIEAAARIVDRLRIIFLIKHAN